MKYQQVALLILDGWGYTENTKYNAIYEANPQYFNHLWSTYPHTLFEASGEVVGLPKGTIGTSEIGHTILGAGSVIDTDLVRINKAITNDTLKDSPAIVQLFNHVKTHNTTLHLIGLVSPGGVHSHQDHLYALLRLAKNSGVEKVVIHVFTDGRDTPPKSGAEFVAKLERFLAENTYGVIGSVSGRYYAMDRDNNWDRVQKAVDVLFTTGSNPVAQKASEVIQDSYSKDVNDEFILPTQLLDPQSNPHVIARNDGVFFFNFRPDRARELSQKIVENAEKLQLFFVTMTEYAKNIQSHVCFAPEVIKDTLANEISKAGLTQTHIAETEKYAHVTYFLNGWNEKEHDKEQFVLIPSRKDVPTHDLAPEMRAREIADKAVEAIDQGVNFVVLNFANADMVGHTGKWEPTVQAVSFEDSQIKRVVEAVLANNGVAFITADHGNAEVMFDESTNQPYTAHTMNPVPAILTDSTVHLKSGSLADVAPTILELLGIAKPDVMTGSSLIEK
jgi:2,3-bisphosphoglycerate-independent phosphoglycerate mutase